MGITKTALAALLGICVAQEAVAQMRSPRSNPAPSETYGFVYGEFSQLEVDANRFDGGGGGVGWHFSRYLGIQGGAKYYSRAPLDVTAANVELMLTYPASDKFSLYAGLGGAYLHASANNGSTSISGNSTGYRVGLGMEYWFSRPFGLRFGYHRQNAGVVADDMTVGLALRF